MGIESFPQFIPQPEQPTVEEKPIDTTQDQPEEKNKLSPELAKFLEGQVFAQLGIAGSAEKTLEKKSGENIVEKVEAFSLRNIQDSVALFFDYYAVKGITDKKKYEAESKLAEAKLWDEFWLKEGRKSNENGEPIDSEGKSLKDWRNAREKILPKLYELMEGKLETIKFKKEELLQELKNEIALVRSTSAVTFNTDQEAMEKILESGRFIPMTEQSEEERKAMRKTGGMLGEVVGTVSEEYDTRRAHSEKIMGIYTEKGPKPVYAALAGGSGNSREKGGAAQYGDVVFVFNEEKIKNRTIFIEGDSMNPGGLIDALGEKEKMSEKYGLEHRMLNRSHAELAKAMYNVSKKLEAPYLEHSKITEAVRYIEAPILGGATLEDIKEIIINNWEFEDDLDWYKKTYPKYANLFRLAKRNA